MKILICGSRHWWRSTIMRKVIRGFDPGTIVIEGGAFGADQLARDIAREFGFHVLEVKALWGVHGKSAGPIRNKVMLSLNPDLVIAFHNDLTKSKGTKHMVGIARKKGIPVEVIKDE